MNYTLYSYNTVSLREENVNQKIIGNRKYIYIFIEKKCHVYVALSFKPTLFKGRLYIYVQPASELLVQNTIIFWIWLVEKQ